jgi:anti-sigma-D factor RsdA-like protein
VPDDPYGSSGNPSVGGREPHDGSNGKRITDIHARPTRFDELSEPVDLVAVQADDELINALAAGMSVSSPGMSGYDADDRVAAILAAWKAEVDDAPIPELVDVDTAVSTVLAARPPSSRARHLAPVAAAAAFLVLVIGGLSVTSYNAQPEDALWGMSKVLYSKRAESVEAAARVEARIASAKEALVAGQPVLAAEELSRAEDDLAVVRPQEGQSELAEAQDFLEAKAAETPQGQSVNPASPLSTQPARRVPESVREPSRSPSESGSSGPSETSDPGRPATQEPEPGPEVASKPGGSGDPSTGDPSTGDPGTTTRPTNDPRRAQVAPEAPGATPTSSSPQPDGKGEGKPDDPAEPTGSPSATQEGRPDPTTTSSPAPPPSGGGDSTGNTGPSAAGTTPESAGN